MSLRRSTRKRKKTINYAQLDRSGFDDSDSVAVESSENSGSDSGWDSSQAKMKDVDESEDSDLGEGVEVEKVKPKKRKVIRKPKKNAKKKKVNRRPVRIPRTVNVTRSRSRSNSDIPPLVSSSSSASNSSNPSTLPKSSSNASSTSFSSPNSQKNTQRTQSSSQNARQSSSFSSSSSSQSSSRRPPAQQAGGSPISYRRLSQGSIAQGWSVRPTEEQPRRVVIDLLDDEKSQEEKDIEFWFGEARSKVVGIRYYKGMVSNGENVMLQREPRNPYDNNAIQIMNIHGTQVGHIQRGDAKHIAPLMDSLESFRVEGIIPSGAENMFSIPVKLDFYGNHEHKVRVQQALKWLAKTKWNSELDLMPQTGMRASKLGEKLDQILKEKNMLYGSAVPYEDMCEENTPKGIKAELFTHQKKALAWMIAQEKERTVEDELKKLIMNPDPKRKKASLSAFFWRVQMRKGKQVYFNAVTNHAQHQPPKLARGGILADDMGLGKTLSTISLIVAQKLQEKTSGPTLIVCPMSVMNTWLDQIETFCGDSLSVYVFHGSTRTHKSADLLVYDVVVTTYGTLASGCTFAKDLIKKRSILLTVNWRRVVLDEAHIIKNRKTNQAKACFHLQADSRWCLTGTPIQNKLQDLFSLVRFLRLDPLAELDWWNRIVERPLKSRDPQGFERLRVILETFCLRRTKDQKVNGKPLINLPMCKTRVRKVKLTKDDQELYDDAYKNARGTFHSYLEKQAEYANILEVILRLRQLCCHSCLVPGASERVEALHQKAQGDADLIKKLITILTSSDDEECSVCLELLNDPVITPCAHPFCSNCIQEVLLRNPSCPLCRRQVNANQLIKPPPQAEDDAMDEKEDGTVASSAKLNAFKTELEAMFAEDPTNKVIVFSQFTKFLNLMSALLTDNSISHCRLDGRMTRSKREKAIETFQTDPDTKVFLISLRAGGVGLNLAAANHVFLMDPWWNPATEDQAIDRCHRIGQTRTVSVVRFIASDTIEERILDLHVKKRAIAAGALGTKSRKELQQMRLNDLKLIFR